ncbi:cytochrome c biogenesis protein [Prosthecobacter vanneervenii]|uniref:ABC-type transport system involved in cytochrome c biogenesis permease subunit n=1 Tax=Prosthecobacter vanneervenii TaxID=48466 RepID=A0A7W8DIR5_9BACT|nr:cytochrome c biogenesis protein CcsA [Prosthecobacter vanneervenii]MBB5031384.1 ABC-type transport system involved in cytochrome c biogenesis permease subunit [Prosthecobacter vanneervenii]
MKILRNLLLAAAALTGLAPAADLPPLDLFRDKEVVESFASLPVQESGRIKPFETLASYRLLRFRARRSLWLTDSGEMDGKPLTDPATQKPIVKEGNKPVKLSAVEWMLMSWFRPDIGKTVPLFKVDNSSAISELGLTAKAKRDQYSFAEVEPARQLLMQKMGEYRGIPARKQSPEQRMIVQLAANFLDYEMILGHFDFIRIPFGEKPQGLPAGIAPPIRLSKSLNTFVAAIRDNNGPPMQIPWFRDFARGALGAMMSGNPEQQFRIFPPAPDAGNVWDGPGTMIFTAINGGKDVPAAELNWLAQYEDLYLALPDAAKFKTASKSLLEKIQAAAKQRGEGGSIALERHATRADYFFYAQWIFLVGFVAVALTWVSPGSGFEKGSRIAACLLLGTATTLAVTGVVIRCLIMQRPPITTLYETILFIGASCALLGLIAESITRRGLGLLVAAISGTACMFLSIQFEASEATDTLQQLQAVLITNFWLSTHVPMINLGYAASMVAALISMIYFVQRLFGVFRTGADDARLLTRVAYGFICAGLFLSLVGTVLGGIWANYSWGRFWGWDPKENGALMIVLMSLVILHARLGGYIREIGLHCCNLILGCIVVFSWFGVNQLGVGLHAYGFTDGTWPKIYGYWLSQLLLLGYGLYLSLSERQSKKPDAAAEAEAAPALKKAQGH